MLCRHMHRYCRTPVGIKYTAVRYTRRHTQNTTRTQPSTHRPYPKATNAVGIYTALRPAGIYTGHTPHVCRALNVTTIARCATVNGRPGLLAPLNIYAPARCVASTSFAPLPMAATTGYILLHYPATLQLSRTDSVIGYFHIASAFGVLNHYICA